jgi:hypothetical protein
MILYVIESAQEFAMSDGDLLHAAKFEEEQMRCWQRYFGEDEYQLRISYSQRLLVRLYALHLQNKTMYKSEACRLIPLRHFASADIYVNRCAEQNLLAFQPDNADKRRIRVVLTEQGQEKIRSYLCELISLLKVSAKRIQTIESPPT